MGPTDADVLRPLGPEDLVDCRALSDGAGWNQTDDDWRLVLELAETRGITREGRVIASAAMIPYGGRIGWVCMVLVAASARRQGLATRLVRWANATALAQGLVPGLDATPAGREVYRQMGYHDIYTVTRLLAKHPARESDGAVPGLSLMAGQDLDAVVAFDAPRFGADRAALLVDLRHRAPRAAHVLRDGAGALRGFVLARAGSKTAQIGPLVATDDAAALALFNAALEAMPGPVIADVPDAQRTLLTSIDALGFVPERPFTRMLFDHSAPLDRPAAIFALTGPEFA